MFSSFPRRNPTPRFTNRQNSTGGCHRCTLSGNIRSLLELHPRFLRRKSAGCLLHTIQYRDCKAKRSFIVPARTVLASSLGSKITRQHQANLQSLGVSSLIHMITVEVMNTTYLHLASNFTAPHRCCSCCCSHINSYNQVRVWLFYVGARGHLRQ